MWTSGGYSFVEQERERKPSRGFQQAKCFTKYGVLEQPVKWAIVQFFKDEPVTTIIS